MVTDRTARFPHSFASLAHVVQHQRILIASVILAVCSITTGCGSKSEKLALSGKVSLDGEPVANGEIVFTPKEPGGRQATAPIVNGAYEIDERFGAEPGVYAVSIKAYRPTQATGPGNPYATDAVPREQYIPRQFNDQTTLEANVAAGATEHNFELQTSR